MKVVKKIALPALAIGALVLTGGAAIGALPALSTMIGGLGLSAGVTSALTAAVATAAKGALVGGITSAISGGNILKGAGMGAGVGFAAGGLLGAGGLLASKAGTAAASAAGGGAAAAPGSFQALAGQVLTSAPGAAGTAAAGTAAAGAAGAAGAGVAAGTAAGGGGLLGSVLNPMTLGPMISGIGQGLGNAAMSKDAAKQAEAERARVAANYGLGNGLLASGAISNDPNRPTPTQRFDPRTYGGSYQFDPAQGRVVFVPNQEAA